jgi:predicted CXXCH cytochrome family protein
MPTMLQGAWWLRLAIGGVLGALLLACSAGEEERAAAPPAPPEPAQWVGRAVCADCHPAQMKSWLGSHHDLAIQAARPKVVLGDFADATFEHEGVTSTFYRRGEASFVRTEGPEGQLADYEVAYAFGVEPLQQYLIRQPGGRLQVLGIAWDSRPAEGGGQRWFHLVPDERLSSDDPFHWTGREQTWNHMCAECHSTQLRKNYVAAEDRYETDWAELNVSCEACHGPGGAHVAWARGERDDDGPVAYPGVDSGALGPSGLLKLGGRASWVFDPGAVIARRGEPGSSLEVETCARCHSRRAVFTDDYVFGRPLLDSHRPALLDEPLYYADGQILDEVYVYGSFLQSPMYAAGVTCSDCHDPHALELRAEGNALCRQCHLPERFDTRDHHFHPSESAGASCVECHMTARTYMLVDPRRDHSFRVPRPDLSVRLGTPNACIACHDDRSDAWAADAVTRWYPDGRSGTPHYGDALHAGRTQQAGARAALLALVDDRQQPAIVRATALGLLRPSARSLPTVERALADSDPLLRVTALQALEGVEPATRLRLGGPLLRDPVRGVRIQAASLLVGTPAETWRPAQRAELARALDEYRSAQRFNADRPEAHLNLGVLEAQLGEFDAASAEYLAALRLRPDFTPASVNLADLYRAQGRDEVGELVLRAALGRTPESADLHHALGLLLVRTERMPDALVQLERAAELASDRARYAYVYAIALQAAGQEEEALAVLRRTHEAMPGAPEPLFALAALYRDRGERAVALEWAETLLELAPDDPRARALVDELAGPPPPVP